MRAVSRAVQGLSPSKTKGATTRRLRRSSVFVWLNTRALLRPSGESWHLFIPESVSTNIHQNLDPITRDHRRKGRLERFDGELVRDDLIELELA